MPADVNGGGGQDRERVRRPVRYRSGRTIGDDQVCGPTAPGRRNNDHVDDCAGGDYNDKGDDDDRYASTHHDRGDHHDRCRGDDEAGNDDHRASDDHYDRRTDDDNNGVPGADGHVAPVRRRHGRLQVRQRRADRWPTDPRHAIDRRPGDTDERRRGDHHTEADDDRTYGPRRTGRGRGCGTKQLGRDRHTGRLGLARRRRRRVDQLRAGRYCPPFILAFEVVAGQPLSTPKRAVGRGCSDATGQGVARWRATA